MLVVDPDDRRRPIRRRRASSTTAPPSPTAAGATGAELGRRIWLATWPKLAAIALGLAALADRRVVRAGGRSTCCRRRRRCSTGSAS